MRSISSGTTTSLFYVLALAQLTLASCSKKAATAPAPVPETGSSGGADGEVGFGATTIPKPPTNLVISGTTATALTLTWSDNASNELFYEIEICKGAGCTSYAVAPGSPLPPNSTTFSVSGLTPNTQYRVQVRAAGAAGGSDWLISDNILTTLPPPAALTVQAATDGTVDLAWTAAPALATAYQLQACSGSNCTNFKDTLDSPLLATATSHTARGLSLGTVYRFQLRATSATNTSVWLTDKGVTTVSPVATPTNFVVQGLTDQSIQIGWTNTSVQPLLYDVQRCSGVGCTNFVEASGSPLPPTATTYFGSDLSPGTSYTYRIRATAGAGSSDWLTGAPVVSAPAAPTALSFGTLTSTSVPVKWVPQTGGTITGYEVQRCNGASCTNFVDITGSPFAANATQATATGLASATTYSFRVRALNGATASAWLTGAPASTNAVAAACTTPTTIVLDQGHKSNTTATGRGLWSDLKVIPGTNNYATAYYDGSATGGTATLKISYWTGSGYAVENVAGDSKVIAGSAVWVKLLFLSNGQPLVFWATGALTVKAAARSAPFGTAGTWTAAVIDTNTAGSATRALEVAVNPLDQVAVAYLTNTTTAGRARFIYCTASCATLSNYVPMTATTDTVEASNVIAATMDIGVGWCQHNATTYYPAVVYPGNAGADIRYSSCLGSLTTCKTAAGWSGQATNVVATAGVVAKLMLDPTVASDTPKILTRNAANSLLQVFQMNQTCDTAPAYTFTAGNTFGAATSGTAWAKLLHSATGYYHVITNLGTTNIAYYNSLTTALATTGWNTIGTLDTLTLPAAGAGGGGADVSSALGEIFTSYGGAAAPFNLNVGTISDITQPSSGATFYQVVPDITGNITLPLAAGQTRMTSMASTSVGYPAVAYVDSSVGAAAGALLKFAFRKGLTATTPWETFAVPNTTSPQFPSLAFDQNDMPWIAFYDAGTFRYNLVTNSAADGSGNWSFYQFPINAKVASATTPATDDVALVMSYYGGAVKPLMIIMNSTAAGGQGVRASLFDPTSETFGAPTTIDAMGASFGTRLTADYTTSGGIIVAFYDLTATKAKVNVSVDGVTWLATSLPLSALATGREGLNAKFNPMTGQPAVSYYDRANNFVYYQACTKSLLNCATLGNWTTTTVASAVNTTSLPIANEQVLNTALTFSADGTPYVGYATGMGAGSSTLQLSSNASGTFVPVQMQSVSTAAVAGAAPLNFALPGLNLSAIRTPDGAWISTYTGPNNWQYVTSCGE